ncbi:hypothetical protein 13VV501A_gene0085 [Vibrio phage 13VV501A]|nr:hypothetical protein 13VV501A_gene0085 [Vibrio phage 13VV501A]
MSAKLTTSEFIERARLVHGDRYDYDRTVYVNNRTKLIITCREHGDFEQTPYSHTQGRGCASCGGTCTLTTETFIAKARQVHGYRYDYNQTEYVNNKRKVIITCTKHGDFEQTPALHTQGGGCPSCSGTGTLTTAEFITKARAVHCDKYCYSKSVYVNNKRKVIITCPVHGDFEQRPNSHTRGKGCPSCGGVKRNTAETFIEKARAVHGSRYDYSRIVYVNKYTKIIITCPEHGDFKQTPNSHCTQGSGCPSCADYGYQPNKTGYLYFLLDTDTHSRIKIGISNDPSQRIQRLRSRTPFQFEPMEIIETAGEIAPQLEKLCHDALPSADLTGFDGATEWMRFDGAVVRQLIETCESYRLLDTTPRIG